MTRDRIDALAARLNPAEHPQRSLILAMLVLALQVVVLDTSILNVALKVMALPSPSGLGASQAALEWAVNAYTLIFAGLLFSWGLLSDRFGRKRILVIGLVLFGLSSLLCAYSTTIGELITARAALGAGGAAIMPTTLAVIANVFPRHEQAKAIGIWTGSIGIAIAIGPVVGGALLNRFWWGSVFLPNVPIVAIVLVAVVLAVPESKNPTPGRLNPIGVLLLLVGLVVFIYGIILGGDSGDWTSGRIWGTVVVGLVLIGAFVFWELRCSYPALDVRLFCNRSFSIAVAAVSLNYFALLGGMFVFTFYLQAVRGLSPLSAGLWSLPFAASQLIFAPMSPALVRRFGVRTVASVGLFGAAAAFLCYGWCTVTSPIWVYGLVAFMQGSFMANVTTPATASILAALPREQAGIGSAVNNTVRQVGGALGVAALGTVLSSAYRSRVEPLLSIDYGLPVSRIRAASSSIQATRDAIGRLPQEQVARLVTHTDVAFVQAMHLATLTAAGMLAFAGVIVSVGMRDGRQVGFVHRYHDPAISKAN